MKEWLVESVYLPILLLIIAVSAVGFFIALLMDGPWGWLAICLIAAAIFWPQQKRD